jgi:hypothetical protein
VAGLRTPELEKIILDRLAAGETLRQICKTPGFPSHPSVIQWTENDPLEPSSFAYRYACARRQGFDVLAEEMLEIADDATNDFMSRTSQSGQNKVLEAEHVNRSRLRIDARKWLLSKMRPDKYGDFQAVQVTGAAGGPVQTQTEHVIRFVEAGKKELPPSGGQ